MAPGYSLIVKIPMCIRQMEDKTYKNIDEFKRDVSGDYYIMQVFILYNNNSHNIFIRHRSCFPIVASTMLGKLENVSEMKQKDKGDDGRKRYCQSSRQT